MRVSGRVSGESEWGVGEWGRVGESEWESE